MPQSYAMRYGIKTLIFIFTTITLSGCASLFTKKEKLHTIAFYNVEKLYDTELSPQRNDLDYTAVGALAWDKERYDQKIKNIATVIEMIGGKDGAAILGIAEVENKKVAEDIASASPIRKHNYSVIHYDSPDPIGLDLALFYKPKVFSPTAHKSIPLQNQSGRGRAREIIEVKGMLEGELVTIYLNHWPENNGNAKAGTQNRRAAATTLRRQIEGVFKTDPNAKVIVMGDFDEVPSSPALEQVLRATGRPNPAYKEELFNTFYMYHVQKMGSFYYRGRFQMLDQIMLSKSFLTGQGLEYVRGSAQIHAPDFARHNFGKLKNTPKRTFSGTTYLGGYSDHFPVYIKVRKLN